MSSTTNASSTTLPKFSSNPAESPRGSATPHSGAASTPTTKKRYTNASSLNTRTNQEDKRSTTKTFSGLQGQSSQVTTTSFYRSRPRDITSLTARENEGRSAAAAITASQTATNALTGANVPATLPPSIVKSRVTKRLRQATKNNTQAGGTDTRRASRRRPYDSRTPATRTTNWRIWSVSSTTSRYETENTLCYMRDASPFFLTPCRASPSQVTGTHHLQSPTRIKPQPPRLRHRNPGARRPQHQHQFRPYLPQAQAHPPPSSHLAPKPAPSAV